MKIASQLKIQHTTRVLLSTLMLAVPLLIQGNAQTSRENTVLSSVDDRTELSMTVYQNGLAMVQDARQIQLLKGLQMLSFENVSNQLIPASALFSGDQIAVLQQVFDYALMSKENMLRLSTGKDVKLIRTNPKTGEMISDMATIIATEPQLILKTVNGIQIMPQEGGLFTQPPVQSEFNSEIVFTEVPEGLSKAPALKLFLEAPESGLQRVDLTYLTDGLNWKADYIARLNADRSKLSLRAFATITNNTDVAFQNTVMNVVAGDVPRIPKSERPKRERGTAKYVHESGFNAGLGYLRGEPVIEALGNVQLFKLPAKVSLESQQTRQFPLLPLVEMEATEILTAAHYFSGQQEVFNPNHIERPVVHIQFKNTSKSPLPKGELRLYETDSNQKDHLTGELRMNDTAENEETRLLLGQAYNFKIIRKQLDWKPILDYKQKVIGGIARYEITVTNAGDTDSAVNLVENFSGITEIKHQSISGEKLQSSAMRWVLNVPAKGEALLRYTISTQSQ